MKLVIEIEQEWYERACKATMSLDGALPIYQSIKEGTPYKERPHGEWIMQEDEDYKGRGYNMCSVCNWKFSFGAYPLIYEEKYCPHCAAAMGSGDKK